MQRAASCAICTEFYSENDNIVNTKCGHVFHEHCFENWKSRSNQCAQCRAYTTKAFRIYLIFGNCEAEDATVGRAKENLHENIQDNIKLMGDLVKSVHEAIDSLKEANTPTPSCSPPANADPPSTVKNLQEKIKALEEKCKNEKCVNENIKLLNDVVQSLNKNIERLKDSENNNNASIQHLTTPLTAPQNRNQFGSLQSEANFDDDDSYDDSYGSDDSFGDHESYDVEQQSLELESEEENIFDLLQYAKQLKNYGYKSVYLNRGRVTVRRLRNSEPIYIENSDQVYQLMCSSQIENDDNVTESFESDYDYVDDDEEEDGDDYDDDEESEEEDNNEGDDNDLEEYEDPYELFQYAKNLKQYGYKSVYLSRGTVIVRQHRHSRPIYIRDRDHVNDLMASAR